MSDLCLATAVGKAPMSRDQFFCGLLILAAANGLVSDAVGNIVAVGLPQALLNTFGVSAMVPVACFAASRLLYRSGLSEGITIPDAMVGIVVLLMTILPVARFSWLALAVLGLYMFCIAPARSPRRAGALTALAVTGPMLWGPWRSSARQS